MLNSCSVALVGKYTKLSDCYASVFKALEHSAIAINHKLDLMVRINQFFPFIVSLCFVSIVQCF